MRRWLFIVALLAAGFAADAGMVPTTQPAEPLLPTQSAPATLPASRPCSVLSDDRGQLRVRIDAAGPCQETRFSLSIDPDRTTGEYEISRPGDYFDGRIIVRFSPGFVAISGWRYTHRSWQITAFSLEQRPTLSRAEWTIRTPAGMPDITDAAEGPLLADLLRDRPDLRTMLDLVLSETGSPCWDAGPYVAAVLANETPDGSVCVKALDAIELLGDRNWRTRERGEADLENLGWPGVLALRSIRRTWRDRRLSDEQLMRIDRILAGWPNP